MKEGGTSRKNNKVRKMNKMPTDLLLIGCIIYFSKGASISTRAFLLERQLGKDSGLPDRAHLAGNPFPKSPPTQVGLIILLINRKLYNIYAAK